MSIKNCGIGNIKLVCDICEEKETTPEKTATRAYAQAYDLKWTHARNKDICNECSNLIWDKLLSR